MMTYHTVEILAIVFVFFMGIGVLVLAGLFIFDSVQNKNAIRHNYPIIGHFRYIFSKLGEFFRQYFFAFDREEMPFNRAERNWVNQAADNKDTTLAFGSTKNLDPVGTVIFVNCPFPTLQEEIKHYPPLVIGPYCENPYIPTSFFNISAMSYGSISKPAIRALSRGAKLAGCWLNTGEGGLSPYHLEGECDIVFQIGTAKYGVRDDHGALSNQKIAAIANQPTVKMFELKLSQGAKPGKGGILPGNKVTEEIANIRGIPVGEDSLSPNRHPEINSVTDILDMINKIRTTTKKPTGFKCVLGAYGWLEQLMKEIHRRGIESAPDFITLDSGDGGSGAAPMALLDNVGLPIRESLPMVSNILHMYDLSERIHIIASGKLLTPSDVAWALCAGAHFVNTARGFMFSLGCIQAMRCNKNTCPTGITTHKARLQRGLNPMEKSSRVYHYAVNMRKEVDVIAHACGVHEPSRLKRFHARVVQTNGTSLALNELYPIPAIKMQFNQKQL